MVARWLYRKSDGVFLQGGFYDVPIPLIGGVPDPAYGIAEFGDADQPDPRLHRYDPATGKRLATAPELAAQADADLTTQAALTSRQRDILATVALIVKRSNPTAWTSMTAAQKRAAVLNAADEWRDLRVLVDKFA